MPPELGTGAAKGVVRRLAGLSSVDLTAAFRPRGAVVQVSDGVARVVGLTGVGYEHLVDFDSGSRGMIFDLDRNHTDVVLLSDVDRVRVGDGCSVGSEQLPSLRVSNEILGRIVDPLGNPRDDRPAPSGEKRTLFWAAPSLTERAPVDRPLLTGVMVIDAAIPIGRGQRQLLIGDRNTGKTALALDLVAAQRDSGVLCVYVAIGQPISRILGIHESLRVVGALARTVVVAADAFDAPGLQYLAPYAGQTIAEFFRNQGRDVLVVFDDLTKHADAYRELALLLGRPPGREAYPGDIFHIHAELLERAAAFSAEAGGGSITALPIVETTDSDISAYIPTNLISITDGQLYLDTLRFERNQRPAVDIGRSVSRIGGAAQLPVMRNAAKNVRIDMARFESLEALTRVGLDVDPRTQQTVQRGRILRELLRQPRLTVRTVAQQVLALTAVAEGWLDGRSAPDAARILWSAADRASVEASEVMRALDVGETPPQDWSNRLHAVVERALASTP